ncbi:MAG: outer membrane lipoprotein carrier protein LolA [Desulfosarcinaceae bacterium]|nr:outer membrane lipoprotein carrier protein LolA [Desulfosarcinaceae bacterium]
MRRCLQMVLVTAALFSIGWTTSWSSIHAAADAVRTVQSDFTQEKHLPILQRPLVSKGRFAYEAPGNLRWEYHAPARSILLMQGGETRRFLESQGRLVPDRSAGLAAMSVVMDQITAWLQGRFDTNQSFAAELVPGGTIVLTPTAAGMAKMIHRIELQLAAQPGAIDMVTIYEDEAAFTRLKFHNLRLNHPLEEALFREAAPHGA